MMSLKKINYTLGLLISLSFAGCDAKGYPASSYAYKMPLIKDIPTSKAYHKLIKDPYRSYKISLSYQTEGGNPIRDGSIAFNKPFVESTAKKSSRLMNKFLRNKGIEVNDCRGIKYNLNIYVVKKSVMQDHKRFGPFYIEKYGQETLVGEALYGFYDSTPEKDNDSTILITDMGNIWNEEVLAHEMGHYWWDRLCLAAHLNDDPELFAQDFHKYYMRNR